MAFGLLGFWWFARRASPEFKWLYQVLVGAPRVKETEEVMYINQHQIPRTRVKPHAGQMLRDFL